MRPDRAVKMQEIPAVVQFSLREQNIFHLLGHTLPFPVVYGIIQTVCWMGAIVGMRANKKVVPEWKSSKTDLILMSKFSDAWLFTVRLPFKNFPINSLRLACKSALRSTVWKDCLHIQGFKTLSNL